MQCIGLAGRLADDIIIEKGSLMKFSVTVQSKNKQYQYEVLKIFPKSSILRNHRRFKKGTKVIVGGKMETSIDTENCRVIRTIEAEHFEFPELKLTPKQEKKAMMRFICYVNGWI